MKTARSRGSLGPVLVLVLLAIVIVVISRAASATSAARSGSMQISPRADDAESSTVSNPRIKIMMGWVRVAPVRAARVTTPYDRETFPHWRDAEDYGWTNEPNTYCDTRQAALARDGRNVKVEPDTCDIITGTWEDPYTGTVITKPRSLDVDHAVPLAAAYRAGADQWTKDERTEFANSPGVVITVSASANRSKGDQTPDEWRPDNQAAWCDYGQRWATVKHSWNLAYESTSEKAATIRLLQTC